MKNHLKVPYRSCFISTIALWLISIAVIVAIILIDHFVEVKNYPNTETTTVTVNFLWIENLTRLTVVMFPVLLTGCMIVLSVIFHQYLYLRIMSFGDSVVAYGTERDQTLLKYIEKNRKKDGEEYWPVYDHVMIKSIAVEPKQDFLFYMTYSDNEISGLSACVLQDNLGNWFISDSTLGHKFSEWRGDRCTYNLNGEEKCEPRKYSQFEIQAYLQAIMDTTSVEIMRARCGFEMVK